NLQTPAKLISRNPFLGFRHEVNSEKPLPEGQMRIMEYRPGSNSKLITALIAIILMALFYMRYLLRATPRTLNAFLPFKSLKVFTAFAFITVTLDKIDQINFHRRPP